MRRVSILGLLLLLPALVVLTAVPGCGKKEEGKKEDVKKDAKKDDLAKKTDEKKGEDKKGDDKKGGEVSGKKEALKAPLDGIIKGRVVLDGSTPAAELIKAAQAHKDCAAFPAGDNSDQQWLVSKDGGVANVVVYLKPPSGKYFEPSADDKMRKDVVTIDQPKCAFEPRVVALNPWYFDGNELKPTGQKFKVLNSATFPHNTKYSGNPSVNPNGGETIPPKGEFVPPAFKPQSTPLDVSCDFHGWMKGKVWVFDHPYAAVTDKDGKYEIKNVPIDVEVSVFVWHEAAGYVNEGSKAGKKMKFSKGENKQDFKVPAPK